MEEELLEKMTGIYWDKPFYKLNDEPFVPIIWDDPFHCPEKGFNTVRIQMDGRMQSDLNWKQSCLKAREWIEKGYHLFWEIDLGLFSNLPFPLTTQSQYLSLSLSLDHFRDTIWNEFGSRSVGLSVYRGTVDFSQNFVWDQDQILNFREWIKEISDQSGCNWQEETGSLGLSLEQIDPYTSFKSQSGKYLLSSFCRNVSMEYLKLLTNRLPDHLPRYLLLDASSVSTDPLGQVRLLNPELFETFGVCLKGHSIPFEALGWNTNSSLGYIGNASHKILEQKQALIGLCLPAQEVYFSNQQRGFELALRTLVEKQITFRLISESHLVTQWDGLDYLLFLPEGLGLQGKRKLQGFCAAGGVAVTLGAKIGFSQEMTFEEFQEGCL